MNRVMTADSNVFVYVWDERYPEKTVVATQVFERLTAIDSVISTQVISEVQSALNKKLKLPAWKAAQYARNVLASFDTYLPSRENIEEALSHLATGQHSYWDALMLTAARDAGCTVIFSEDMHHGGRFGPVEIVNPFGASGPSDRARELLSL